jgi:hypothetical protein
MLKVSTSEHSPIKIAIDNRYYKKHAATLTIGHLPQGRHYLKIYAFQQEQDGEAHAHLLFEGKIRIFEGQVNTMIFDQASGDLLVSRSGMENMNQAHLPGDAEPPMAQTQESNPRENTMPAPPPVPAQATTPVAATSPKPEKNNVEAAVSEKPKYPLINKDAMKKLSDNVSAKITDTDKLKVLQNGLAKKSLKTDQLKTIMSWLNFESSRVELAKWAYNHTVDKENFSSITSHFTYQDSKDEMNNYINGK